MMLALLVSMAFLLTILSPLDLTTIGQPLQKIAQKMVQTLLSAISSNHQNIRQSVIPPTLLQGETTTKLAD